jgi:hypothetical protein
MLFYLMLDSLKELWNHMAPFLFENLGNIATVFGYIIPICLVILFIPGLIRQAGCTRNLASTGFRENPSPIVILFLKG